MDPRVVEFVCADINVAARQLASEVGVEVPADKWVHWRHERSTASTPHIAYWMLAVQGSPLTGHIFVCFHSEGEANMGADWRVLVEGISAVTDPHEALREAFRVVREFQVGIPRA